MEKSLIICRDISDISKRAASRFLEIAGDSISKRGVFYVALSGGSTPESLYRLLSTGDLKTRLQWDKIQIFWGDERCVGPDDRGSNYRMAFNALIGRLDLPKENIHRIKGEDGEIGALDYEKELRDAFNIKGEEIPEFDLILLGMGDDGHTASIFPESSIIREERRLVVHIYVERFKTTRITLTPPVINNALNIIFLVNGDKKAYTLHQVLEGEYMPDKFPSQLIRQSKGEVVWFVDEKAGMMLL